MVSMRMALGGAYEYEGDGCSALYAWGPQLEAQPVSTSYVPRQTGPARRAIEKVLVGLGDAGLLIEASLPQTGHVISIVELADGTRIEYNAGRGQLNVVSGDERYTMRAPVHAPFEPFVLGVYRKDSSVLCYLDGVGPLEIPYRGGDSNEIAIRGGPLHLRRTMPIRAALSLAEFSSFSTLDELDRLDRPVAPSSSTNGRPGSFESEPSGNAESP